MARPRNPNPSPGALRKRRWDQRMRERVATLQAQLAACEQQLATCQKQNQKLVSIILKLKKHWIAKRFLKWIK